MMDKKYDFEKACEALQKEARENPANAVDWQDLLAYAEGRMEAEKVDAFLDRLTENPTATRLLLALKDEEADAPLDEDEGDDVSVESAWQSFQEHLADQNQRQDNNVSAFRPRTPDKSKTQKTPPRIHLSFALAASLVIALAGWSIWRLVIIDPTTRLEPIPTVFDLAAYRPQRDDTELLELTARRPIPLTIIPAPEFADWPDFSILIRDDDRTLLEVAVTPDTSGNLIIEIPPNLLNPQNYYLEIHPSKGTNDKQPFRYKFKATAPDK